MLTASYLLTATLVSAFLGVLLLLLLPPRWGGAAKWIALISALTGFAFAFAAFRSYDLKQGAMQFTGVDVPWIASLGIHFATGADGVSLVLLLLTGIIAVTGVLFSWNVTQQPRAFFALFLTIIGGSYGVFQSLDLFLLFVCYEVVIIPKYFLISNWGSTNREYGAMKLTIYSVAGSALVLLGIIGIYALSPIKSLNLTDLVQFKFPVGFQLWAFPVMFIGFGVLAGMWPLHTWAPTGHVAAPTAVSMLLAGVVMKLGSYGALRVAMTLFPEGLAHWRIPLAILASIGLLYGALVALVQRDLKFVVGYSSINHMGFVLLGLLTLNSIGLSGAVLQMFSHGIIGSLLFAVVGRMIYDRTLTRDIDKLGAMGLAKALPFAAFTFTVASAASMGIPGFSGFIAELQILLGTWKAFPVLLIFPAVGAGIAVAYTLRALQRSFFPALAHGNATTPVAQEPAHPLPPITFPERLGAIILMAATLGVGLFPKVLIDPILQSFQSPNSIMHHLIQGVAK
jgi:NADH-quinone oxidoreductase subunit M